MSSSVVNVTGYVVSASFLDGVCSLVKEVRDQGVCKQWNGLLEWWNGSYYEFLHPQLAYFHILSILHLIIDQTQEY